MSHHIPIENPDPSFAAAFRYRPVKDRFLVTNQVGQYTFLTKEALKGLVEGSLDPADETYKSLAKKNFIQTELDVDDMSRRFSRRKWFLGSGPHLHIVEVTLRCNQTCVYCHSSRAGMDETDKDMTPETAEKVVDMIFETSSPAVTIEFQGGEPLVNYPVVQHVIEYGLQKARATGKRVDFSLVTNLSLMDEEKLAYLLDQKVQICTSIDGPPELHNKQRVEPGGDAYANAVEWIRRINQAYADMKLDTDVYHVEGLLTTTARTLELPKEVVDTYIDLGFRALFLRPVDPFGFANKTERQVAFSAEKYLDFYRAAVDHMIELNRSGTQILERYASIFLTKILRGEEPNFLDLRSPCGAATGQVAYTTDGEIFVCDEARMLHRMGDDLFQIGSVSDTSYQEAMHHDTVRALMITSNLDGSPDCAQCVYNPYCGICPVYNYATQGSLHGQQRTSTWCAILMGIQDYLFEKILANDQEIISIFDKWTAMRPRDHYEHGRN